MLSPLVVTRAQRRSWGARPTIYMYRMPVRNEDATEIGIAALIGHVAEIGSASVNKEDAWASKVDAEQLRSIKVTLNNWGQIDDWTLDREVSAKINVWTAVTLWHVILAVVTATHPPFAGIGKIKAKRRQWTRGSGLWRRGLN